MEQRMLALARASGAPRMDHAQAARALGADLAQLEAALAAGAHDAQGARTRTGLRVDQAAAALSVLTDGMRVSVINAPAGSGKTWVLAAVGHAWAAAGLGRVIGITPSQSARNTLAARVPGSYNAAQFLGHLPGRRGARGPVPLQPGDLVLMDEASMTANPDLADVIAQAAGSGAKLILAGDTQQLQAVENGGGLSLLAGALGFGLAVITGTEDRQHAYVALSRGTDTAREAFGPLYLDVLGRFDALFGRPMPYISLPGTRPRSETRPRAASSPPTFRYCRSGERSAS